MSKANNLPQLTDIADAAEIELDLEEKEKQNTNLIEFLEQRIKATQDDDARK